MEVVLGKLIVMGTYQQTHYQKYMHPILVKAIPTYR
jgi:hypothetical protein